MKKDKKMFILMEVVLGTLVMVLSFVMLQGNNEKQKYKISVIVENADDNQWSAFKYGLKMAAEDRDVEMSMVSTGAVLPQEEEKKLIEQEIKNGADGIIIQPISGADTKHTLKKVSSKIKIMLIEDLFSEENAEFPVVQPDNYAMGKALAEELLKDYGGNLEGKTLGILMQDENSQNGVKREQGFRETLQNTGVEILWSDAKKIEDDERVFLENQPKVDCVIALDDSSLTAAGECAAANNLHGALIYGIGNSTKSVYYLDTGLAECLVVPDTFNIGYQSLTELVNGIDKAFYRYGKSQIDYSIMRRENLFSKENQDTIFTMSQ